MNYLYNPSPDFQGQDTDASGGVPAPHLLTLPGRRAMSTSIRATALVFEDPLSQELLARIERIAPSNANVLIVGDTGTGKELIARHVHHRSLRRSGPFVAVNCGAFSEQLVESELFGHEKGAFTGAAGAKAGWFEAAQGGTLFLDEIGDLSLALQVKLLRVLQEREVVRLGSRRSIPIDVRVVAATNVRLEAAVVAGHFREDLYYRLHVAQLHLLPLRERPGDILPLALHFLAEYRSRLGYGPDQLDQGAERRLLEHAWPGNIRELENVIHHALLIASGARLRAEDLHFSSHSTLRVQADTGVPTTPDTALVDALHQKFNAGGEALFEQIEDVVFRAAYAYCDHNQLQASRLLGISRNVLRARLIRSGQIDALR